MNKRQIDHFYKQQRKKKSSRCLYPGCLKRCKTLSASCCDTHISIVFKYEKPDECPVCCESFKQKIPLLPCCHWICQQCVISSGHLECPECRQTVTLKYKDKQKTLSNFRRMKKEKIRDEQLEIIRQLELEGDWIGLDDVIQTSIHEFIQHENPIIEDENPIEDEVEEFDVIQDSMSENELDEDPDFLNEMDEDPDFINELEDEILC